MRPGDVRREPVRATGARRRGRRGQQQDCSPAALQLLRDLWTASGRPPSTELVSSMPTLLATLEHYGEAGDVAVPGEQAGHLQVDARVRHELLAMSLATIDEHLASFRLEPRPRDELTRPPAQRWLLDARNDEAPDVPGWVEAVVVDHDGADADRPSIRTVMVTCRTTGWVFLRSTLGASVNDLLAVLDEAVAGIPFEITRLDLMAVSDDIGLAAFIWGAEQGVRVGWSRPDDVVESVVPGAGHDHLVRRFSLHHRYESMIELRLLNRIWCLVCLRTNYLAPTAKPVGWLDGIDGRRRLYDQPTTPVTRLIDSRLLSKSQAAEHAAAAALLKPAKLARDISYVQDRLIAIAWERLTDDEATSA
jgi:hypothetical protein